MGARLRIVRAGPGVSLQDRGRSGWLRFGVHAAGPMDPQAFATANRAAGAEDGAATIEVSLGGVELAAEGGPVRLAIAGAPFGIFMGEERLPSQAVLTLEPGTPLRIRAGDAGMWTYVAFASPLSVEPVLGSVATHLRTGLGGIGGRCLLAGDVLPLADGPEIRGENLAIEAPWLEPSVTAPIRVMPGPQDDHFPPEEMERFFATEWTLSNRSDRMGAWLDGAQIGHRDGFNIVSDGIAMGSIQVPGSGRPLVLMGDRQPTGGYPKIATVIWADLGRFAQLRPGETLRFAAVGRDEAVAARRALAEAIARLRLAPLRRTDFTSEYLLERELVDGVWRPGEE